MAVVILVVSCLIVPSSASSSYTYWTNKTTPNYTTTNLDILYDSNKSYQWSDRIYSAGCFVTSYAMILNNLGKTTKSQVKDIRTNSTGYLVADPFTVTFANTNFASISSSGGYYLSSYTSDPVYTYPSRIATNFDATYTYVDLTNKTEAQKAYNLAYYINKYPQGVGIQLSNSTSGTHCIVGIGQTYRNFSSRSEDLLLEDVVAPTVVTDINYTDIDVNTVLATEKALMTSTSTRNTNIRSARSTYDSYFTVCDPVSTSSKSGDCVLFSNCWAGGEYTIADIQYLRIIY